MLEEPRVQVFAQASDSFLDLSLVQSFLSRSLMPLPSLFAFVPPQSHVGCWAGGEGGGGAG